MSSHECENGNLTCRNEIINRCTNSETCASVSVDHMTSYNSPDMKEQMKVFFFLKIKYGLQHLVQLAQKRRQLKQILLTLTLQQRKRIQQALKRLQLTLVHQILILQQLKPALLRLQLKLVHQTLIRRQLKLVHQTLLRLQLKRQQLKRIQHTLILQQQILQYQL